MQSKYEHLRIERWKTGAAAAAAGAGLLLVEQAAEAAPATLPFTVAAGGAKWYMSNSTSANSSTSAMGITDASLLGSPTRDDAYDGAFIVRVNGVAFHNPTGTVDLTGTTVTSATVNLSGLNTSMQYFFDPGSPTVRLVASFTNPSGAPITATIQWHNNLGSDSATTIAATSSGDGAVSAVDRWFVSWDGNPTGDPVNTFARYGPGAALTPTLQSSPGAGSDNFFDQYTLTVPAGQTRRLMFFGRLSQNTAAATSGAAVFNSSSSLSSAGLLAGLTAQQESEIVNWSVTTSSSVPALGPVALVILAVLLALLGMKSRRWIGTH